MLSRIIIYYALSALIFFLSCGGSISQISNERFNITEKKDDPASSNYISRSLPHLHELSTIAGALREPCEYFHEYFNQKRKLKVSKIKGQDYCQFDYHGMIVKLETVHKGSDLWFIRLNIAINSENKEKIIGLTIENDRLVEIGTYNRCYPGEKSNPEYKESTNCGATKKIDYENQFPKKGRLYCNDNSYDDPSQRELFDKSRKMYYSLSCGNLFEIDSVKIRELHNNSVSDDRFTCNNECFDIIPILKPDRYFIRKSKTILRKLPSRNSQIVSIYQMGDSLEVLEDSGNIEEINFWVAPWVKVRMFDGKEGFIFGALIKKEGEFFPY